VDEFRRQVLSQLFDVFDKANLDGTRAEGADTGTPLVVSHRPVKRKVTGYLHKEDMWGAVDEEEGVFRIRCPIASLNPKMLRMPEPETDDQVRKRLIRESESAGMTPSAARKAATNRMQLKDFKRLPVDPSLGKGGLVRDWDLRRVIRECLKDNKIDPDCFTDKQMQEFAKTGKLRMPNGGVPIRAVITIGPISDPVKIAVRDPNTRRQAVNPRTGKPLFRYHISRNNHHVEIMQDSVTWAWSARDGKCVTMFEAAQRIRPPKNPTGNRPESQQAVNREDAAGQAFVMSLSEGEMVFARRWDPATKQAVGASDYFVVAKLDGSRIFFAPHWDARSEREQDRWDVPYGNLKHCGPTKDEPPFKVRVSPLGKVVRLDHD
jgi:hypothetical protein